MWDWQNKKNILCSQNTLFYIKFKFSCLILKLSFVETEIIMLYVLEIINKHLSNSTNLSNENVYL